MDLLKLINDYGRACRRDGSPAWESDEGQALKAALESRASNAGGAVVWMREGATDVMHNFRFEQPESGPWVPLYTHPAPASKEPVADERAAFEAWHREKFQTKHSSGQPTRDMHNGKYVEHYGAGHEQERWEQWQAAWKSARAALATAQTVPEPKSSNHNAGGTQAYLATEHYNEGWNDCRNAMLAAAPAKPEGV